MDTRTNAGNDDAHWDLFCRVIDNHGDVGVCWRLACDLAERGEEVRLWIDDASALAWMAPHGAAGVDVRPWTAIECDAVPGKVAIEAFGCDLPDRFIARMAAARRPPVWINLEYLSAEGFVERSHLLRSPQPAGPGAGLNKWVFYPGFTPATGGLIRERDLSMRQQAFDARAWLAGVGVVRTGPERIVSLFCYEQPGLCDWLNHLASDQPTLLLATVGHAARQVAAVLGPTLQRGALRAAVLPALTQRDYDHLLWASDLNFVRGEDSFVRAQWAAKPFVWHIYPQQDGVHLEKLEAFLTRFLTGASEALAAQVRRCWEAWNVRGRAPAPLPLLPQWQDLALGWRTRLLAQPDLSTQLCRFVDETS